MARLSTDLDEGPAPGAGPGDAAVIALLPVRWTVEVEARGSPSQDAVTPVEVRRLLDALADRRPSVGFTSWSYSARFTIGAPDDALAATARGVDLWQAAVEEAELPSWAIERCEVRRR